VPPWNCSVRDSYFAMPFLGVDQSLNGTGLCLLTIDASSSRLSTVDPGKLVGGKRLVAIKEALVALCRSVEWRLDFAAIEGYSMGSVNRPFDLGEVGGIIRLTLTENDVPYEIVPPVQVKQFATGATGASKEAMITAAQALGASPATDDEADAFFLARIARAYHSKVEMSRREMDVIHALKNPKTRAHRKKPRKLIPNAI
jgi:Holliday junction resolvasome RuvABC endonuclease subunit